MNKKERVAILGASNKTERYSFKAQKALIKADHKVFLINPKLSEIDGLKCEKDLAQLSNIDTLTMYVAPSISNNLLNDILKLSPKRVIFNPGTENPDLQKKLMASKIMVEEACTLVLLSTNQF